MTLDPYELERFVEAQDRDDGYLRALEELRRGRKETHWIWWVFPQLVGLGWSATSRRYAIGSLEEARAFLAHPILGPRLREASTVILSHRGAAVGSILGDDDVKLRSCATLFTLADPAESLFREVLDVFFNGDHDTRTEQLLVTS
ncbi:MAG TPA: DUF1810 domain-containing protein [Acidimicrobiales bacterium]|nr:DUF1810 domain-containing protein [Acidimicrobiales bacterium]